MATLRLLLLFLFTLLAGPAGAVPLETEEGFLVPQPGRELEFPHDHGSHPMFKIEWWYLTGHLFDQRGRRFGYQATFFRYGLQPESSLSGDPFGSRQVHLTHMALTDPEGEAFHCEERLSRDGWDARARVGQLDVRNGNWSLEMTDNQTGALRLRGSIHSDVTFDLHLVPQKPLIRFGADGTSRKGPAPEARSYYLSYTRLMTEGTVHNGEGEFAVAGSSWMDHEIASSQLDSSYTGWDWIAIQLDDGWEVKAYLLREADGGNSPCSALIWISPDTDLHYRGPEDFEWDKSLSWTSPETGHTYPIRPVIRTRHPLSGKQVEFRFEPVMQNLLGGCR